MTNLIKAAIVYPKKLGFHSISIELQSIPRVGEFLEFSFHHTNPNSANFNGIFKVLEVSHNVSFCENNKAEYSTHIFVDKVK